MKITDRVIPPKTAWALAQEGIHPLMANLYATRGITLRKEISKDINTLLSPEKLKGALEAARLLDEAIEQNKKISIVADYDCDGATSCAVAMKGLAILKAKNLTYLVPDRITDGYGLTEKIAQRVADMGADILITVDNGIASVTGVAHAKKLGLTVIITDHHLPGDTIPLADAIVNPNQPGCTFESKNMAGVGVIFYVLLMLRILQRKNGRYTQADQPRLDSLLPIVALGTIADLVKLDTQNRCLVDQGLQRIRKGHAQAGLVALFQVSGKKINKASTADFSFGLAPRLNAAGRMSDMTIGIECLLTDDPLTAKTLAEQLDKINLERRNKESTMRETALSMTEHLFTDEKTPLAAVTVFSPDFHEGIVGIVASKLKDKLHRPTFVFAQSHDASELKGSGRSIAGFHLRDALDLIAKRSPNLIKRFGGHAMAAGCTIDAKRISEFEVLFAATAKELIPTGALTQCLDTDGPLNIDYFRWDVIEMLDKETWGQGFPTPLFYQEFEVLGQRLVGDKHLGIKLKYGPEVLEAIWFGRVQNIPPKARLAFRIHAEEWNGKRKLKLLIEAMDPQTGL